MRYAPLMVLALALTLFAQTNLPTGRVAIECGKTNIVWENCPPIVIVQGRFPDSTNWVDLQLVHRLNGEPQNLYFGIPTADRAAFYRLRTP